MIEFLPGNPDAREEVDLSINRLVENNIRSLPEDCLAYHQTTLPAYRGMRGPIIEAEEFLSAEACARCIIQRF